MFIGATKKGGERIYIAVENIAAFEPASSTDTMVYYKRNVSGLGSVQIKIEIREFLNELNAAGVNVHDLP